MLTSPLILLLCWLHSFQILLSSCWTNPFHQPASLYLTSLSIISLCSSSCASCSLPICFLLPSSHPSSINSFSLPSLSTPSSLAALFPWLFWQPSVELIHELVLGQCNQPLFVAHYQLPGAELFTAGQKPFVVWLCSLAQRRGSENKCKGRWAYASMYIHTTERERGERK